MKDNYLKYLKGFSSITLRKVCKELKINYTNALKGNTTIENYKRIKAYLESEIAKLYIIEDKKDGKTDSL